METAKSECGSCAGQHGSVGDCSCLCLGWRETQFPGQFVEGWVVTRYPKKLYIVSGVRAKSTFFILCQK